MGENPPSIPLLERGKRYMAFKLREAHSRVLPFIKGELGGISSLQCGDAGHLKWIGRTPEYRDWSIPCRGSGAFFLGLT